MNNSHPDTSARIDALEMRFAEQENTIAELNDVLTSQWRKIDHLERQIAKLLEEVQNMVPSREGPEAPPPHY